MGEDVIKKALGTIVKGVAIIGSRDKGKINGMTAAWISQVSFEPTLIMVSVGKTRLTHTMIENSKVFSVSVLGKGEVDLAKHFGFVSGSESNKFKDVPYELTSSGCPILKDCIAHLDCRLLHAYPAGDHSIFVGEVIDAQRKKEGSALIYHAEEYFGE